MKRQREDRQMDRWMAGGRESDKTERRSEGINLQVKWLQIGRNSGTITATMLEPLVSGDTARGFLS